MYLYVVYLTTLAVTQDTSLLMMVYERDENDLEVSESTSRAMVAFTWTD